jgi:hypothetical protein
VLDQRLLKLWLLLVVALAVVAAVRVDIFIAAAVVQVDSVLLHQLLIQLLEVM